MRSQNSDQPVSALPALRTGASWRAESCWSLCGNIEKSYPHGVGRTYVLRRVNVDHQTRRVRLDHGTVGRGKVDASAILGMHDSAWTGEYYFMTSRFHQLTPRQRASCTRSTLVSCFQSYHLLDNLTVYEKSRDSALVSRCEPEGSAGDGGRRARPLPNSRQEDLYPKSSCPAASSKLIGVARPSSRTRR